MNKVARRRAAGAVLFDPTTIAGLKLWLKADGTYWQNSTRTTPATADADPVGAWDDFSGNSNHATQTATSARPALKKNIQNGHSVLRTDAVNDYLQLTLGISLTGALTIYCVGRRNAAGQLWMPLGSGTASNMVEINDSDDKAYIQVGATFIGQPYTGPNNQHIIARWKRDSSNVNTFRSTGTAETTLGTLAGTLIFNAVCARPFNGLYAVGDYDEMLIFDGEIGTSSRTSVERLLADRFGLTF